MSNKYFVGPDGEERVRHPDATVCCVGRGCGACANCGKDCEWCALREDASQYKAAITRLLVNERDWEEQLEPVKRHLRAVCDGCKRELRDIEGTAWQCTVCSNYDLCTDCYPKRALLHPWLGVEGAPMDSHPFKAF